MQKISNSNGEDIVKNLQYSQEMDAWKDTILDVHIIYPCTLLDYIKDRYIPNCIRKFIKTNYNVHRITGYEMFKNDPNIRSIYKMYHSQTVYRK